MTGASDTKPIWPDRMPNVNVNAKIIDHPAWGAQAIGETETEIMIRMTNKSNEI